MRATRKGFTIVELAVVIAIVGIIALPIGALLTQYLRSSTFDTGDINAQSALNSIAATMEDGLRTATRKNGNSIVTTPGKVTFDYYGAQPQDMTVPSIKNMTYELKADGLFYVNATVYPDGLAAGTVTNLSFPTGTDKQQLTTAPYFITFHIEAINATLGTNVVVEKTVSLQDY